MDVVRSGDRKQRVLAALRGNRLTKSQLCERFAVSRDAMKNILESLMRDGAIRRVGHRGRSVSYEGVVEGVAKSVVESAAEGA